MRKILSITLSLSLLITLFMPAFAGDNVADREETNQITVGGVDITINVEEEINRALMGITDLDLAVDSFAVFADCIGSEPQSDWSIETFITTREIQLQTNDVAPFSLTDSAESKIYATTGVAVLANEKHDSNIEYNKDTYVTAYATLFWRDNFGSVNDFLGASGGWDVDKNPNTGTFARLSNRTAYVEWYWDAGHRGKSEVFNYYSNEFEILESDFPCTGRKFYVHTNVTIDGSIKFPFVVTTSIFT